MRALRHIRPRRPVATASPNEAGALGLGGGTSGERRRDDQSAEGAEWVKVCPAD